jgi:hypothetical protein
MKIRRTHYATLLATLTLTLAGCRQDMHDQPRVKAAGKSTFFADMRNNRPLVPGTVARGRLQEDDHLYRGRIDGKPAETFPFAVTADVLARGRERYSIFCMPCHSPIGDGNGMIVQRGLKRPPSLHIERLQAATPGYMFEVITNGFGVMYDFSDRISVEDRWAIIAYLRALQRSQNATVKDVPAGEVAKLSAPAEATPVQDGQHGHDGK